MDSQTLLVPGTTTDYLVVNDSNETSWYRVDYDIDGNEFPEVGHAKRMARVRLILSQIYLPFAIIQFISVVHRSSVDLNLIEYFLIFVGFVFFWWLFFTIMFDLFNPVRTAGDVLKGYPFFGITWKRYLKQCQKQVFEENPSLIPNYHLIVRINNNKVGSSEFIGYQVTRWFMSKTDETTGYGLNACYSDGHNVEIIGDKEIGDREFLYGALQFSLVAIGRDVKDHSTYNDASLIGTHVNTIQSFPDILNDLDKLSFMDIGRDVKIPIEYLRKIRRSPYLEKNALAILG